MNALVVGESEPAAALTSALAECGLDAELHVVHDAPAESGAQRLAQCLVELERRLVDDRPSLAVAVGAGDAPLALALTATKVGIPLVAWIDRPGPASDETQRAEERILRILADCDAGPVGHGGEAFEAAERIASWADLELAR